MAAVKVSFGKSDPYHSGWRGWSDHVDVFVDEKQIGTLRAEHCDQRRYLEYHFHSHHPAEKHYPSGGVFGLRAAKAAVKAAITKAKT